MTAAPAAELADMPRRRAMPGAGLILLSLAGINITVLYAVASARMNLPRFFPEPGISTDFVKMLAPGWEHQTVLYVGFVLLTFGSYFVAVAVAYARRAPVPALLLWGFPALFSLTLLPMYPPTAIDMLHYHAMSRVFWVHGANPLTVPAMNFEYPIGISFMDWPSSYGPLWSILTAPAAILPGDNLLLGLYGFKLIAIASLFGCAWVIYRLVQRTRPGHESLAIMLFAWNPFVLLRVVGNGHNDLVMMFFALLALERAERRSWTWAFLWLTAAVSVKYSVALLGPPLLLYAWTHAGGDFRARVQTLAPAILLSALALVLVYAPFWAGAETFANVRRQADLSVTSTAEVLSTVVGHLRGVELRGQLLGVHEDAQSQDIARGLTRLAFIALWLPFIWLSRKSFDHLVAGSFTILFLYLLIGASWYRPWYMLWPVAIAALRPRSWLAPTLLAATFFGSFPDLIEQYRWFWRWVGTSVDRAVAAPTVVQFAVPAAIWLAGIIWFRSWHLDAVPRALRRSRSPAAEPPVGLPAR